MQQMTPAELEQYKKQLIKRASQYAKKISDSAGLKIDETVLPGFELKPPVKDFKRLSLLPIQPPTLIQLADGLRKSKQQLESVTPKPVVEEIKKITAEQNPAQLQRTAVAQWYSDQPAAALLTSMEAALKNSGEAIVWNNLAALYNMAGLEHKAIPVLQHWLTKLPGNSLLLNNMGQAYLGLGDLAKAEEYLKQCLAADALNPEANHSMGMISVFKNQVEEAMKYFEKELEMVYRRSTLAQMKRMGKQVNLYQLRKHRADIPHRDYFEEIGLGKFELPIFPGKTDETQERINESAEMIQSLVGEMHFWLTNSHPTAEELKEDGKRMPGLYSDVLDVMWEDLHKVFTPENLGLFRKDELSHLETMIKAYGKKMSEIKCPVPPAGSTNAEALAYQRKCCDIKKPVMDAFVLNYNKFVKACADRAISVNKQYINARINLASLNPTNANKRGVYFAVYNYLSLLVTAWQSGQFLHPPMECNIPGLGTREADSIIASMRKVDLKCPKWFNLDIDLQVAKLKADCSSYGISGGKGLQVAYEKDFGTGTSTISAGVGVSQKFFLGVGEASLKQMLYLSFDNNNRFSDFGLKGSSGISIGAESERLVTEGIGAISTTIGSIEGGYTLGINSGFKSSVKSGGLIRDYIKLEFSGK